MKTKITSFLIFIIAGQILAFILWKLGDDPQIFRNIAFASIVGFFLSYKIKEKKE